MDLHPRSTPIHGPMRTQRGRRAALPRANRSSGTEFKSWIFANEENYKKFVDFVTDWMMTPGGFKYDRKNPSNQFETFTAAATVKMTQEWTESAFSFVDYTALLGGVSSASVNENSLVNPIDFKREVKLRRNIVHVILLMFHEATPQLITPLMMGDNDWVNVHQWDKKWMGKEKKFVIGKFFNKIFEVLFDTLEQQWFRQLNQEDLRSTSNRFEAVWHKLCNKSMVFYLWSHIGHVINLELIFHDTSVFSGKILMQKRLREKCKFAFEIAFRHIDKDPGDDYQSGLRIERKKLFAAWKQARSKRGFAASEAKIGANEFACLRTIEDTPPMEEDELDSISGDESGFSEGEEMD